MISNNKSKVEIDVGEEKSYSINIIKSEEVLQYIENLAELLPETYPNVYFENNEKFYKLWSENGIELFTVFSALIEAIIKA
ncbi:MAG: hypothetical protein ACW98X_16305 [Promethearchaeota archaeon]